MKEQLQQFHNSPHRFVVILLLALSGLYLHGASLQNHLVNTDPFQTDQITYLNFAKSLRETNYNYIVPRNQMPIYPLLQSLNYRQGMTDEEFFVVGKDFNILLSVFILAGLYWIFRRYFRPLMTLNLMLITGFTVFMFKAPFFQTELLFYFLNFIAFLLMLKMIRQPTIQTGIISGLVLGIAHMTKASLILGVILFVFVMSVGIFIDFFKNASLVNGTGDSTKHSPLRSDELKNQEIFYKKILRRKALPLLLLLVTFLASILVYMNNSKKVYGHYFYNVNSTFYVWYDSWAEVKAGTLAFGDHAGWPTIAAEKLPGPQEYFREHSMAEVVDRLRDGLLRVLSNSLLSYGYFIYFVIYSLVFFTLCLLNLRLCLEKIRRHYLLIFFIAAYLIVHLLAVAWYTPIAKGNRFILAYFLPYMFVLFYVLRSTDRFFGGQANRLLTTVNFIVLVVLTGHIYYIMSERIATFYGGL